ncbi:TMEM175 family protein [Mucilaginibacter calamicampi]|uniref:TMEM175 family protein n=1 Tax=Mucilaginibacter calamicampi TaxID=1302352 RepID=A0ABW2Z205_9SPHI
MLRTKAAKLHSDAIAWRSHEPSRLETFSDAVFAFALTLIILSIEVPKSFDELTETMSGTLSFAACFAVLFNIWNRQNVFFRRFGVNDTYTAFLNAVLLFVVLVYAFPLKFLCDLLLIGNNYHEDGKDLLKLTREQIRPLMLIYSVGLFTIYLLFYLMYSHAQKFFTRLELTEHEIFEAKTVTNINLLCMGVCTLSIMVALAFPDTAGRSGYVYFLFPFVYMGWFSYRGKKKRKLFGV